MKKLAGSFLLIIITFNTVFSQFRLGIKGGFNIAKLKYESRDQLFGEPEANSLVGYHLGAIIDIDLNSPWAFQTGAMISSKGSNLQFNNLYGRYTNSINPVYFEIPANLLFKPYITSGLRFYLGLGPYIGFGIGGKSKFKGLDDQASSSQSNHKLKFGNGINDDLKKRDFGGNLLAGFEFNNGLILGAQYELSFTNSTPKDNNEASCILRNRVFSASIGYLFTNNRTWYKHRNHYYY